MSALSLRTRLLGAVLGLLAVAAVVIAVVTTAALRDFLVGQLDDELGAATGRFENLLPPGGLPTVPVPAASPLGPGQPTGTIGVVIRDGQVLASSVVIRDGSQQPVPGPLLPTLLDLDPDGRPSSVDLGPLGDYRIDATRAASGDRLVIGLPERALQDTVTRLAAVETAVLVATLLGVGVAGAFVVRRELRPLERVAATAARVTELPLDRGEVSLVERVPVGDPGTEVGQVGTALNRMLEHVGAALEARQDSETRVRQFVADASHELRTPLASIRGYAELMTRSDLADADVHSLSRISSQAERMTTLVEDLLLLARLDAGRPLEQAEVDLTRLVLDAVSDARVSGPGYIWRLELPDEPVTVVGDTSRLAQVLANLLVNARTHTPPGTVVTVALSAHGAQARLRVTDDGPGIPGDLAPHVFERFARGSTSRSREHGSTGLGLAIVDAVVMAHRGTVRVDSRPGRTEFTVALPTDGR